MTSRRRWRRHCCGALWAFLLAVAWTGYREACRREWLEQLLYPAGARNFDACVIPRAETERLSALPILDWVPNEHFRPCAFFVDLESCETPCCDNDGHAAMAAHLRRAPQWCTRLETLDWRGSVTLEDEEFLANLPRLKRLRIYGSINPRFAALLAERSPVELLQVRIDPANAEDWSALRTLTRVRWLRLDCPEGHAREITALRKALPDTFVTEAN
jgi:hypothetical protein